MIAPREGPLTYDHWAADRASGSTALTLAAAQLLLADLPSLPLADEAGLAGALRRYGLAHPAFGALWRLLDRIARVVQKARREGVDAAEMTTRAADSIRAFGEDLAAAQDALAREGAALVPVGGEVATYSRSGAVEAALLEARKRGGRFRVVLAESRPALEGLQLARTLGGAGIPVMYCTDASLPLLVTRASVVLVGADAVLPGGFVNKSGTWPLLLAAREASVPVYCLAARAKFLAPAPGSLSLPLHESAMVLDPRPENVDAINVPLEEIPLALVRGVVTEAGLLTPGEAAQSAKDSGLHASLGQTASTH